MLPAAMHASQLEQEVEQVEACGTEQLLSGRSLNMPGVRAGAGTGQRSVVPAWHVPAVATSSVYMSI